MTASTHVVFTDMARTLSNLHKACCRRASLGATVPFNQVHVRVTWKTLFTSLAANHCPGDVFFVKCMHAV